MATISLSISPSRTIVLDAENIETTAAAVATGQTAAKQQAAAALRSPMQLPRLASCLLPDDHVAIALAEGTPCADQLVAGAIDALREAHIEPCRIAVVSAVAKDAAFLTERLTDEASAGVEFVTHDPADQDQLCFAGATHAERPLMINRKLFEAEVTIPISVCKPTNPAGKSTAFSDLFPTFSDTTTIERLSGDSQPATRGATPLKSPFASEAEEAGWMLGVTFVMQAVPNATGGLAGVFVGPAQTVAKKAGALSQQLWQRRVSRQSRLVIAAVTGDAQQQTWANVARALALVDPVVAPGGAVAVCCDVQQPLAENHAALLAQGDIELAHRELAASDAADTELSEAHVVRQILQAIERGPLFLMSGLEPDWVEEIGLAPVASEQELSRLAQRMGDCVVIEGAQHASLQLEVGAQPSEVV